MSLVAFFIVTVLILAALYVIYNLWTLPRPVQVILTVACVLIFFFMLLALFGVMSLPFRLT